MNIPNDVEKIETRQPPTLRDWLVRLAWLALLAFLLWWAMKDAPLVEIWASLRQLTFQQITLIFVLNAIIFVLITMRWWIIIRAENARVPLLPMIWYRVAVFGLSYFTPGPQVGGEPLQVLYLQKNFGLTYARAISAVIMDKLLEFLTNFLFLGIGLYAAIRVGLFSGNEMQAAVGLVPLIALMMWPLVHLILLYSGRLPLAAVLRVVQGRFGRRRWMHLLVVSERLAAAFCRRRPVALLASLGVSLLAWIGMGFEYALMVGFLNISLDFWQVLAGLTTMQLAFLLPLPAGLGALEASQVFLMQQLGFSAAVGISLSLLVRARDVFNGGIGLLIASGAFNR